MLMVAWHYAHVLKDTKEHISILFHSFVWAIVRSFWRKVSKQTLNLFGISLKIRLFILVTLILLPFMLFVGICYYRYTLICSNIKTRSNKKHKISLFLITSSVSRVTFYEFIDNNFEMNVNKLDGFCFRPVLMISMIWLNFSSPMGLTLTEATTRVGRPFMRRHLVDFLALQSES